MFSSINSVAFYLIHISILWNFFYRIDTWFDSAMLKIGSESKCHHIMQFPLHLFMDSPFFSFLIEKNFHESFLVATDIDFAHLSCCWYSTWFLHYSWYSHHILGLNSEMNYNGKKKKILWWVRDIKLYLNYEFRFISKPIFKD